jgi:flagellar biosynthetic protein FliP
MKTQNSPQVKKDTFLTNLFLRFNSKKWPVKLAIFAASLLIPAVFLMSGDAIAQSFSLDLGEEGSLTGRVVQLILMMTILSLAPSILIVVTSFTRIIIVLSILRNALGTQQTPPNIVLVSLALFLTGFIMAPTFQTAYEQGLEPLINEEIDEETAMRLTAEPFRVFMLQNVRDKDLALFLELSGETIDGSAETGVTDSSMVPYVALVPAFMIGELKRAFEIGFLLYIPFLVIDMVVASILMSMGMMMLPPVMISLPFKLIFFVLVDGWNLVAGSLVQSFASGGG